jgi:basic amino acid/polyamine antiporter, APA family
VTPANTGAPKPTLTLFDAVAMIVGIVIGAGIFRLPSIVAGTVSSEEIFIMMWIAGGVISLIGALCYAELGSAYPNAGGEYHFLSRAYGSSLGFLFGWARMTVVQTGAIAAIGFVFADYAMQLLPLGERGPLIYALLVVVAITALNIAGTRESKNVQKILTASLLLAIGAVIVVGFLGGSQAPAAAATAAPAAAAAPYFTSLTLILILFTYGGWNEAAYLTAEVQDPRRNIVRALVLGIVIVTVLYVALNLAYVSVLGLDGLKGSQAPAADLMRATIGGAGAVVLSLIVVAASVSTLNATIFTGARTNYALGRDYSMFSALGRWNERSNTPVNALLLQGGIAIALVIVASGTKDGLETMVAYTAPAFWLFFMLTGISLFILRKQQPAQPDPFRVPLYPITPILFIAMCAFMLWSSITYAMSKDAGSLGAQLGVGVLLAGIPLMFLARKRRVAIA